jgi:hypothetical protein
VIFDGFLLFAALLLFDLGNKADLLDLPSRQMSHLKINQQHSEIHIKMLCKKASF